MISGEVFRRQEVFFGSHSGSPDTRSLPILCCPFRDIEGVFAKRFERVKKILTKLDHQPMHLTDNKLTHRGIELLPSSPLVSFYTATLLDLYFLVRLTGFYSYKKAVLKHSNDVEPATS